jgi:hypothetical protein
MRRIHEANESGFFPNTNACNNTIQVGPVHLAWICANKQLAHLAKGKGVPRLGNFVELVDPKLSF